MYEWFVKVNYGLFAFVRLWLLCVFLVFFLSCLVVNTIAVLFLERLCSLILCCQLRLMLAD